MELGDEYTRLIYGVNRKDEKVWQELFDSYYESLCNHAARILLDLSLIHIYFHEHLITQLVHFPVVAAHDAVILFVELVIISFQLIDSNERCV